MYSTWEEALYAFNLAIERELKRLAEAAREVA
jgi:hypothetical protein